MKLLILSTFAFALFAMGGIWRAHSVSSGDDWGMAVSESAKMYPGAVADHIKGI